MDDGSSGKTVTSFVQHRLCGASISFEKRESASRSLLEHRPSTASVWTSFHDGNKKPKNDEGLAKGFSQGSGEDNNVLPNNS
ncbi:hypothetical protein RBSH_00215 [Rhodopirellula baltica SH28]|uniref:Uncharacterized protein n=1 Tax=Rhodopirellula baltica SH28 TaxID=993517 RepID=K5DPN3_RHOBT|nr:hypothetical protein RBSH_00215 [Rhodopirellula baltica SH28]